MGSGRSMGSAFQKLYGVGAFMGCEAIVRASTSIPDTVWERVKDYDVYFSGEEAVQYGIAQEVGEFSPPAGFTIFSL